METKVRYLVDTNVWLERLLDQEKSEITSDFFNLIPTDELFVSDFSIHSIGVILSRLKKYEVFETFIDDLFVNGQLEQLTLDPIDLLDVMNNIQKYKLDFDDSYQFAIAQKFDLILITFDKDFNVRGIKKNTPDQIIEKRKPY
jgi:predicted nucleic acid-binding protein